jgi:hypothetical protein
VSATPWKRNVGVACYVAAGCCAMAAVALPILSVIVFLLWIGILVSAATGSSAMLSLGQPVHAGPEVLVEFAVLIAGVVGGVGVMVAVLVVIEVILIISAITFLVIGRKLRRT